MFSSTFGRVMAIACISVLVMAAAPLLLSRSLAMYWDSVPMNSLGSEGYGIYERDMPICWLFVRDNCVVDANTIRLDGQVIWITQYRAPLLDGSCVAERQFAKQARQRLSELLSTGRFRVSPSGFGHSGVSPASVDVKSGDLGKILVGEGLAHGRRDKSAGWCEEAGRG